MARAEAERSLSCGQGGTEKGGLEVEGDLSGSPPKSARAPVEWGHVGRQIAEHSMGRGCVEGQDPTSSVSRGRGVSHCKRGIVYLFQQG